MNHGAPETASVVLVSSEFHHEMESINAWSSASVWLFAIATEARCACCLNSGERVSGKHICTSRSPLARMRLRCALTFSRDDFAPETF